MAVNICAFCGAKNDVLYTKLFCQQCGKILALPKDINAFAALSLFIRFDIDLKELDRAYLHRLSQIHPDRFQRASKEEKEISYHNSEIINNAYSILKADFSRAIELLKLAGIAEPVGQVDHDFLMQTMLWREELESADSAGVKKIKIAKQIMLERLWGRVNVLLNSPSAQGYEETRKILAQIKMLERFLEEIGE